MASTRLIMLNMGCMKASTRRYYCLHKVLMTLNRTTCKTSRQNVTSSITITTIKLSTRTLQTVPLISFNKQTALQLLTFQDTRF